VPLLTTNENAHLEETQVNKPLMIRLVWVQFCVLRKPEHWKKGSVEQMCFKLGVEDWGSDGRLRRVS